MNYQHAYHAGNFADVHKHVVLHALLQALQHKPSPLGILDTHAGAGGYALDAAEAIATGEYTAGIARLAAYADSHPAPSLIQDWLTEIHALPVNQQGLQFYPGSPLQAAAKLRPDDSLHLCEIQAAAIAGLRQHLGRQAQVHIHQRDGYAALKALLPPPQKRGLVLIDPPYEAQEEEYRVLQNRLGEMLERWPSGVYAVWYPIKQVQKLQPFYRWLGQSTAKRVLRCELLLHPGESPLRLNGSGMVILNAPWQLDQHLLNSMTYLTRALAEPDQRAQFQLDWLRQD